MRYRIPFLFAVFYSAWMYAQTPPIEMHFNQDSTQLFVGGRPITGFYDESAIRNIEFTFPQTNYWNLLTQNYTSKTDLPATMVVDGVMYDSVGVRFKGQTSYSQVQSQKKSFNITTDYAIDTQEVMGYETINLNNCFQDPSFMREVFYLHQIRNHIPAAKGNYVNLTINGQNWGVYANVQQLNKDFYKEWFMTNDGTNWRADAPTGGGGGGWGNGTTALNYLGSDTNTYKQYYTLKNTERAYPWTDLVLACDKLNNTASANMTNVLPDYLDLDRVLWFLASEIAFTDDDSYVYKGRMDYYLYWEKETGRITPIEFDGNSAMSTQAATSWSPFYNETKVNYPLLNKLLAIPELRQRYIAHMRTIITEALDTTTAFATLEGYRAKISALVQADPKKLYSYTQFNSEINVLKNFIRNRRNYLLSNSEIAQPRPTVHNASHSFNGVVWGKPESGSSVPVTARATFTTGIQKMYLYYSTGLVGKFTRVEMFDDGAHNDTAAGDGIYGADIPSFPPNTWVRYYVEAVANNPAKSVTYLPAGAEHNTFIYKTIATYATESPVVINELMASNSTTQADNAAEYDDWVELYNRSSQPVDISGWYLTDKQNNLDKWQFPQGTIIQPNAYLIVWADEDSSQGPYHANFKLSASGEVVVLLNEQQQIVDEVIFGQQVTDLGYARIPNGTGNFIIKSPTFNANNEGVPTSTEVNLKDGTVTIYPNPSTGIIYWLATTEWDSPIQVTDALGRVVAEVPFSKAAQLNISHCDNGMYVIRSGNVSRKILLQR